jgi:hypothetical protein
MQKPIISADSHITEPPNTYTDRIDHKYKDSAPHMIHDEKLGDVFIVKDFPRPINVALAAAAGKDASELRTIGAKFDEMHRGGWDPNARMADQDRDGVAAEVIYPTVGMILCNHRDFDYKKACFDWRARPLVADVASRATSQANVLGWLLISGALVIRSGLQPGQVSTAAVSQGTAVREA